MKTINVKQIKVLVGFYVCLIFCVIFNYVDSQKIRYATRFRNFNATSETGSMYLMDLSIFQHNMEHRIAASANCTKNVVSKNIQAVIQRCTFERFHCEYFQTWKFNENIKTILYMKNQIWSPFFYNVSPRLDFPVLKKNIYHVNNATLNTEALMAFYSEASKYYWKVDGILFDSEGKKAAILYFELSIFEYVDRNRKQERG